MPHCLAADTLPALLGDGPYSPSATIYVAVFDECMTYPLQRINPLVTGMNKIILHFLSGKTHFHGNLLIQFCAGNDFAAKFRNASK